MLLLCKYVLYQLLMLVYCVEESLNVYFAVFAISIDHNLNVSSWDHLAIEGPGSYLCAVIKV